MKAFECSGFWWLPDREGQPAAGTLKVDASGAARLSLIGNLSDAVVGVGKSEHDPHVIYGSVDKSPRGNDVTLVDCWLSGSSIGTHRGRREVYVVGHAYFGAHLADGGATKFRSCMVQVGGLSEWARPHPAIRPNHLPTSKQQGEDYALATYHIPVPPVVRLPGALVTLNYGVSSKSEARSYQFREEANLLFVFDEGLTDDEIERRYVYPIRNLLTFTSDRAQEVERVSVWVTADHAAWEANPEVLSVHGQVQPDGDDERRRPLHSHELLFTLEDVEFGSFLERWLRLTEAYTDASNIFFGAEYGPPRYLDVRFAQTAQSLALYFSRTPEGQAVTAGEAERVRAVLGRLSAEDGVWLADHLGLRPYPTFRHALQSLMDRYGDLLDPLLSQRRDAFVSQAVDTLQYIEQRVSDGAETVRGAALHWLMMKLRFLLKVCLLTELGFGQEKIAELLRRNATYSHMCLLERRQR